MNYLVLQFRICARRINNLRRAASFGSKAFKLVPWLVFRKRCVARSAKKVNGHYKKLSEKALQGGGELREVYKSFL